MLRKSVFTMVRSAAPAGARREIMPEYVYQCRECSKRFAQRETFQEHDRHGRPKCPQCGSRKTKTLIPSVHVHTAKKS
jgi:putative FmdB family regulatory protein